MRTASLNIQYKTPEQLILMRAAGLLVAGALARLREAVAPGVSTAELDAIAEEHIRGGGGIPSFKGYYGYPASLCTSVNEQIVHAIPSPEQVLAAVTKLLRTPGYPEDHRDPKAGAGPAGGAVHATE